MTLSAAYPCISDVSRVGLPELRLMGAVLEDAMRIIRRSVGLGALSDRSFEETLEWVFSDDVWWPFSFRNLCSVLDVDAHRLRRTVRAWLDITSVTPQRAGANHTRPSGSRSQPRRPVPHRRAERPRPALSVAGLEPYDSRQLRR